MATAAGTGANVTAEDVQDRVVEYASASLDNTLANYALGLLVALMVLLVTALVGGEFIAAMPQNETTGEYEGAFGSAIGGMADHAGTAFVIFGVGLLVLPAVGIIVLVVNGFGGFGGLGGNGGGGR